MVDHYKRGKRLKKLAKLLTSAQAGVGSRQALRT
jgi:hypothetical protein